MTSDRALLRAPLGNKSPHPAGALIRKPHQPPPAGYDKTTGELMVRKEISVVSVEGVRPEKKTKRQRAVDLVTTEKNQIMLITFSLDEIPNGVPSEEPLLITALVAACKVHCLLIDGGSAVDILFKSTLDQMEIDPRMIRHILDNLILCFQN
ncbi:unnamed protein product [Linum trigynum]|uniref:Uncharacterized protein n=1 Tax=Linum trigynum TaxID=586398 RepID=A0AAV2GMG5_9ROSI